ncbi:MAG: GH92 family glycosyl hydrolase [Kiritimatiellia bacterium]
MEMANGANTAAPRGGSGLSEPSPPVPGGGDGARGKRSAGGHAMRGAGFLALLAAGACAAGADVVDCVDTRIGGSYRGHTFPGATCPFSLVQASPDTGHCDWDHCSGYVWEDPCVYGFTQTHLSGTGCPDLEDVRLLPFVEGFADSNPLAWRQAKDSRTEIGRPGYYAIVLTNENIRVEATATPRVGVYRVTAPADRPLQMLVDLQWVNAGRMDGAVVEFQNEMGRDRKTILGGRRTQAWLKRSVYWKVVFDRPWRKATKLPRVNPKEKGERWVLDFGPGAPLVVKAAISTVDCEGARKNFRAEAERKSFDEIRGEARERWREVLGRLEVPGATDEQRTAFYTSLYHLFIQPNDIADVDGRYRGGDNRIHAAADGVYYTGFSLWDTFRAAHPFYTLATPERVDGFVNSMLGHYRAMGFLPVIPYFGWESHCMIGNHAIPVIVDAYKKGFRGFDADLAFEAVTNSITLKHVDPFGRPKIKEDWDLYDRYGYYPFDRIRGESVSRTLECGFDDWCAAEFCRARGQGDEAFFRKRSGYWKNVFDPSIGFMRGKDVAGRWRTPYDPFRLGHGGDTANDFTEGNAFQYTWHVLQDPEGLIGALGGNEAFVKKLDALFVQPERTDGMGFVGDVTGLIGQYAHGNEPSHHVAYFYSIAGRPDRTADVVREVCDRFYGVKPGDLCGNDDCGQMSAWYVFAAMGFYPFNPCSGVYVLGAPQFPEVVLKRPGGKEFRVRAKNLSRANRYVTGVRLNGRPLAGWRLPHDAVVAGGELEFTMGGK